ncbi:MAG: hypothetical protein A2086_02115 [Spirochaetes bacterium GWD1_27_9]|nr:MAG: hypothetical protein A2Z98_16480 [Spirochaetes bacterium GWB1_27_13]OHD21160.1 MAG: hypothetical protein A2Y34_00365 [Spirochaetes bacterium GWC1_27_15]OHD45568.1 MAG: hypothetical protein A2086_02115 [Spirochaetes bacterium GWD1_27_9]
MKVLITGSNGTLGIEMQKYLKSLDIEVVCWDRKTVSPFDYHSMENYIKEVKPDLLFHFAIASQSTGLDNESWKINYEWTSELAWITGNLGIKFLFTSTALVFTDNAKGPFTINSIPDAYDGYGYEKRMAETKAIYQNKDVFIVRLGWQITGDLNTNNMVAYLENEYKKNGVINASSKWYPACSFVKDTVQELYRIITSEQPGLYMIDSNDKYNFFEIASILNKIYKKNWKIIENNNFVYEQRMVDFKVKIKKFSTILNWTDVYLDSEFKDCNKFHEESNSMSKVNEGIYFKSNSQIDKVLYNPAHPNLNFNDKRSGFGKTYVKWIYSLQKDIKESIISQNISILHDTFLEPFGSIGLHKHDLDDEIYYIIEGSISVTVIDMNGNEHFKVLYEGDAHFVRKEESHFIETGLTGARFIVVGIK